MPAVEMVSGWIRAVEAERRSLAIMERHARAAARALGVAPEAAPREAAAPAPERKRRRARPTGPRGSTTALVLKLLEGQGGAATAAQLVAEVRKQGLMGQVPIKTIRNRVLSCLRHGTGRRWQHDTESHQYWLPSLPNQLPS